MAEGGNRNAHSTDQESVDLIHVCKLLKSWREWNSRSPHRNRLLISRLKVHLFNNLAISTDPPPTDCVHFVSSIALAAGQRGQFRRCPDADTSWSLLLPRGPLPSSLRTGSSWPCTFQFRSRDEHSTEPSHPVGRHPSERLGIVWPPS